MVRIIRVALVAVWLAAPWTVGSEERSDHKPAMCQFLDRALSDYHTIKVGQTRAEIGKHFVPADGIQFPGRTRYVYTKCEYLHLDVEFQLVKPEEITPIPDDKVIAISKLYIEYPVRD
jgi:hypothetical protein